jgi:hypothetical protein
MRKEYSRLKKEACPLASLRNFCADEAILRYYYYHTFASAYAFPQTRHPQTTPANDALVFVHAVEYRNHKHSNCFRFSIPRKL